MFHPSRGGVRGGADQFEWETVKADKHRENYLGHSLMAPVGRWQKKKDLQWFSREKKGSSNSKETEKEAIRRMEKEAMAAALGKAPVKRAPTQLTKQELEEVFRKGQTERDDRDIERIEGMGFGSTRASLMGSGDTKETMSALGSYQGTNDSSKQADRTERKNTDPKERKKEKKKEKKEKRKKKKRSKSSKRSKRYDSDHSDDNNQNEKKRHRRGHSDENDSQRSKQKSKRTRHDSTTDSDSDMKDVRKQRHDSTSDDEPRSKKKQPIDRSKLKRRFSSDEERRHSKYGTRQTRRQRHDS